jgi:thymidylate synthase (FAD)
VLLDVVRRWTPLTGAAFENYRLHAAELSGQSLAVLRRMLAGETVAQAESGLSAREWRELQAHLQRD